MNTYKMHNRREFLKGFTCTGIALATPSLVASSMKGMPGECARNVSAMLNSTCLDVDAFKPAVRKVVQAFASRNKCTTAFLAMYSVEDIPTNRHVFIITTNRDRQAWRYDHVEWDGHKYVATESEELRRTAECFSSFEDCFDAERGLRGFQVFDHRVG